MIIVLKHNFVKIDGSLHPVGRVIWLNNKKGGTKVPYLENIIERISCKVGDRNRG